MKMNFGYFYIWTFHVFPYFNLKMLNIKYVLLYKAVHMVFLNGV